MERELLRKTHLAARHLEPGVADALTQFGALQDIHALRSRYIRLLMRKAFLSVWRRAAAVAVGVAGLVRLQSDPRITDRHA